MREYYVLTGEMTIVNGTVKGGHLSMTCLWARDAKAQAKALGGVAVNMRGEVLA